MERVLFKTGGLGSHLAPPSAACEDSGLPRGQGGAWTCHLGGRGAPAMAAGRHRPRAAARCQTLL